MLPFNLTTLLKRGGQVRSVWSLRLDTLREVTQLMRQDSCPSALTPKPCSSLCLSLGILLQIATPSSPPEGLGPAGHVLHTQSSVLERGTMSPSQNQLPSQPGHPLRPRCPLPTLHPSPGVKPEEGDVVAVGGRAIQVRIVTAGLGATHGLLWTSSALPGRPSPVDKSSAGTPPALRGHHCCGSSISEFPEWSSWKAPGD